MKINFAEAVLKIAACSVLSLLYLICINIGQNNPVEALNVPDTYLYQVKKDRRIETVNRLNLADSIAVCIGVNKFKYPGIVYAQGVIESGGFSSQLFKLNNNIFGMRLPMYRKTYAIDQAFGFAVFKHWNESIADLRLHYARYIDDLDYSRLPSYLNNVYAHSPNYWNSLTALDDEHKYNARINGLLLTVSDVSFCKIADL